MRIDLNNLASHSFTHKGEDITLYGISNEEHIFKEILAYGFYEKAVLELIPKLNGLYVDVGANIGNHSVYFAKYLSSSGVVAIEPHPEYCKIIKKNAEQNSGDVKVVHSACSDKPSTGYLVNKHAESAPNNCGNYQLFLEPQEDPEQFEIPVQRLDDIIAQDEVGFIKIDVEGGEFEVLKGARSILTEYHPWLLIECKDIERLMKELPMPYELVGTYRSTLLRLLKPKVKA